MCKHGDTRKVIVRGREDHQRSLVGVDACLVDLIHALNICGIPTLASCCGHGKLRGNILLRDGRALIISTNEEALAEGEASPVTITGEKRMWTGAEIEEAILQWGGRVTLNELMHKLEKKA